jgi:hypothetical protein
MIKIDRLRQHRNFAHRHFMDRVNLVGPPHRQRGRIQLPTADARDFTRGIEQRLAGSQRRLRAFLFRKQRLQRAPRRHRLGQLLLQFGPERGFAASAGG